MAIGGFDSIIGQAGAKETLALIFDRARKAGEAPPPVLIGGRKGAGKSAFIQAAAVEWGWQARYMSAARIRKVDAFGEFVYSSVDRDGKFRGPLMPDELCPRSMEGDRTLAIDDLHELGKRGNDALTRLILESAINVGVVSYPLPFRAAIFCACDSGAGLDPAIEGLFGARLDLADWNQGDLALLASEMAEAHLWGDYCADALALAIAPPRDAPGEVERLLRDIDGDLRARGLRAGERVDERRMEDALAALDRTACGLTISEYFYLAALDIMGGASGVSEIMRFMSAEAVGDLRRVEEGMIGLGLIERARKSRSLTAFGGECLRRCEERRLARRGLGDEALARARSFL